LTEAGERFLRRVWPAIADLESAHEGRFSQLK